MPGQKPISSPAASARLDDGREGFAIIAAQFGSFVAGASVASTLLAAGDMTWQQIVLTLLVGNILTPA